MKTNIHKTTTTTATNMFSKMTWFIRYDRDDEQIEGISSFLVYNWFDYLIFRLLDTLLNSIIRKFIKEYHKTNDVTIQQEIMGSKQFRNTSI